MNNVLNTRPPGWFWIVSAILLIWNIMGVGAYLMLKMASVDDLAESYSTAQLEIMATTPIWATGAFAIAVFSGLLGAILLLMRKGIARLFFIISLIAVLVQHFWTFLLSGYLDVVGFSAVIMPLLVVVICVFQIWLSGKGIARGWLR